MIPAAPTDVAGGPARTGGRAFVRAVLAVLGAIQLTDGVWALFAPRSFYGDFPLGRGWVEALPAYNEHLVRDVGALFCATAVILFAAAIYMERRLILVALGSFLVFSVPHAVYHAFNLEPYGTADAIGNVATLLFTVIAPLAALAVALGTPRDRRRVPARSPAGDTAANGRIPGVSDSSGNAIVRATFRGVRKRSGVVHDPIRVTAHHPTLLAGYGAFELATERARLVPDRLKLLAVLRAAMLCGCEWCLDYGSAVSAAAGIQPGELRALPSYRTADCFDERDRLVLDYASGMSRTPVDVPDELFAQLREHFDEARLVELTSVIALENYRARFNWALGLAGQGFAEGGYCVRPAADADAG